DGADKQSALAFFASSLRACSLLTTPETPEHHGSQYRGAHARTDGRRRPYRRRGVFLHRRHRTVSGKEIACLMNFGGPEPEAVERSMRLFGEKVMPRVRA